VSVWLSSTPDAAALCGNEGELVSVSVSVDAHHLEDLLEVLSSVSFPVNPQICHPNGSARETVVEFPAYSGGLPEVRKVLAASGFDPGSIRVAGMLAELHRRG